MTPLQCLTGVTENLSDLARSFQEDEDEVLDIGGSLDEILHGLHNLMQEDALEAGF
ncbi:MAG TPA: hypothetical protein VHZ55_33390 [Bryobacteraceae bacterium]|jgi:hypothetical protein|nr:hypothetical protein [Bryobacteraceae bacterium]